MLRLSLLIMIPFPMLRVTSLLEISRLRLPCEKMALVDQYLEQRKYFKIEKIFCRKKFT